jgi:hypothetical protein
MNHDLRFTMAVAGYRIFTSGKETSGKSARG